VVNRRDGAPHESAAVATNPIDHANLMADMTARAYHELRSIWNPFGRAVARLAAT
jgi:hypothetical protein